MQRHSDNALAVAGTSPSHPKVAWVSYPGLRATATTSSPSSYCPKGAGAVFTFGLKGGYEAGVQAGLEREAVLAPRQYRRHAHRWSSTRPRPRTASSPPSSRRRPARAPTWCACRSASRTPPTSSPTSTRRWPSADAAGPRRHPAPCGGLTCRIAASSTGTYRTSPMGGDGSALRREIGRHVSAYPCPDGRLDALELRGSAGRRPCEGARREGDAGHRRPPVHS